MLSTNRQSLFWTHRPFAYMTVTTKRELVARPCRFCRGDPLEGSALFFNLYYTLRLSNGQTMQQN